MPIAHTLHIFENCEERKSKKKWNNLILQGTPNLDNSERINNKNKVFFRLF